MFYLKSLGLLPRIISIRYIFQLNKFLFYVALETQQVVWKWTHVCMYLFSRTWILSILIFDLILVISVRNVFLVQNRIISEEYFNTMSKLSLPNAIWLSPSAG